MDLNVLLQVRSRGKLFTTDFAFVWFFTRVYSLVPDQIRDLANRYNLEFKFLLMRKPSYTRYCYI